MRNEEELLSDTNNCSGSSSDEDSSSIASYTEFHDSLQYLSPALKMETRSHQRRFEDDWNECFRLPIFQKRQDPLRLLNEDDNHYADRGEDEDRNEDQIVSNACWPQTVSAPRRPSSSRRSSYISSASNISNGSRMDPRFDESMRLESDSEMDPNDNDKRKDDDDDDEYTCSPAAYLYKRSTSKVSTSTAPAPTSSALETSTRRFYYCYPSGSMSSSSLSKCKSAMSGTASSIPPLFLDERNNEWEYTQEELEMVDGDEPTEESNLQPPRRYWIVTTAALPWMTGTAVNPLLRAAYLSQRNRRLLQEGQELEEISGAGREKGEEQPQDDDTSYTTASTTSIPSTVTLVLPWLDDPLDREKLYGPAWAAQDKSCDDQESFIRQWLATSAHLPLEAAHPSEGGIAIQWYPAKYHAALSSIFALGDLCEMIPSASFNSGQDSVGSQKSDMICILEEPEHVNFYRAPGRESWRDRFGHVIGIVHTNYKAYARNHYSGILTGPLVGALSSLMVRAYCDKVVKLSPVLQTYAPGKEIVSNVHGIRREFFHVPMVDQNSMKVKCYFIGKLLWGKFVLT